VVADVAPEWYNYIDQRHVYAWGYGEHGQLGHPIARIEASPKRVDSLNEKGIRCIAVGASHSVALSDVAAVFTWGRGHAGQLGHGSLEDEAEPREVVALAGAGITEIVAGGSCTLAVDSAGELFVAGERGSSCALDQATPQRVEGVRPARHLSTVPMLGPHPFLAQGSRHTVALTPSRDCFVWGNNSGGQLGMEGKEDVAIPTHCEALRNVVVRQLAAAGGHTAAVVDGGDLWLWGENSFGQLGNGCDVNQSCVPTSVAALKGISIKSIACMVVLRCSDR